MMRKQVLLIGSAICFLLFSIALAVLHFYSTNDQLKLKKIAWDKLPNWQQDDPRDALIAFQRSCVEISKRSPTANFSANPKMGKNADWQTICKAAAELKQPSSQEVQTFFTRWFTPYLITNNTKKSGTFTGYYLPQLQCSMKQTTVFNVPVYSLPNDLVRVNLGKFRPDLAGKNIVGQVREHGLQPYPDRQSIHEGAVKTTKVLAWCKDPIDVFFAEIQGSAYVTFPDGHSIYIGYAGDNGRKYVPIGKVLVEKGYLEKKNVSMQSIKTWLTAHPKQVHDILNTNPSYVFFRVLKNSSPIGVEGVPLTKERSMAIDTRYIPLGAPLWVQTTYDKNVNGMQPFEQLVIAQDTGGAIKGVVRGDIYWGDGEVAAMIAGTMNSEGQYWILLPK